MHLQNTYKLLDDAKKRRNNMKTKTPWNPFTMIEPHLIPSAPTQTDNNVRACLCLLRVLQPEVCCIRASAWVCVNIYIHIYIYKHTHRCNAHITIQVPCHKFEDLVLWEVLKVNPVHSRVPRTGHIPLQAVFPSGALLYEFLL